MNASPETKRHIFNIARKIKTKYKPEKIILFGSFAYGQPDESSDIDLLIVKETPDEPIDRRVAVRRLLSIEEDAHISPLVITPGELAHRLKIGDQFLGEILARGEVLYAK
jgi:predicted nucleotidyltransferase